MKHTDKHHILPRGSDMFPEFECFTLFPWNRIILTKRQHYVAHWILKKSFPTLHKLCRVYQKGITSRQYSELSIFKNIEHSKNLKSKSEEEKLRIKNQIADTISKRTQEEQNAISEKIRISQSYIKDLRSELVTEWHVNMSSEERDRMNKKMLETKSFLDTIEPKFVCIHCSEEFVYSNKGNYVRYHGDNCKQNPDRNVKKHFCNVCGFESENKTIITKYHNDNCKQNPDRNPNRTPDVMHYCKDCSFKTNSLSHVTRHIKSTNHTFIT
jgi:hypothetical protein